MLLYMSDLYFFKKNEKKMKKTAKNNIFYCNFVFEIFKHNYYEQIGINRRNGKMHRLYKS